MIKESETVGVDATLTTAVVLSAHPFASITITPYVPAHKFEGLLPEGMMLEALLRKYKIDRNDYFGQIIMVGQDVVGAVTVEELR